MKKDRIELEQNLDKVLMANNSNKNILKSLKKQIKEHNISGSEIQNIWKRNTSLDSVSEPILYLLTKYLFELTEENIINPEEYFNDVEINDGDKYIKEPVEQKIEYPIVFKEVIKGKNDQYMTYLTIRQLVDFVNAGIFTYNFETQRDAKLKMNKEGNLIQVANINKTSVQQIKDLMLDNDFIYTIITINILKDGTEKFEYRTKGHELIVFNGEINIPDGFHRTIASAAALLENPFLDEMVEIRITNWDVDRCNLFINQEDKRNPINKKHINMIDPNKNSNKIVNNINTSRGDIKGKIASNKKVIEINQAYTMFDIMTKTIDLLWKNIENNFEVNRISDRIVEIFDYIIWYKSEDFKDIAKSKTESVVTLPAMFIGYLTIAHKLENDKEWQDKLKRFLGETDFSINNVVWNKLNIIDNNYKPILDFRKPALNNIINYFNERI